MNASKREVSELKAQLEATRREAEEAEKYDNRNVWQEGAYLLSCGKMKI